MGHGRYARRIMEIALIYARAANGVIGHNGTMPWHLPEDLAHFKQLTQGHPVIMGRKTWDSLPARFRPLPGRTNIVVTRQADWHETGAQRAFSLRDALSFAEQKSPVVWVIGGAQIYAQALPLATRVEVTEIARDYEGDAHAPQLGPEWVETARHHHVSAGGLPYSFATFERRA
jgi:dihydrofolate reductase